ncbi:MAG: PQQ-binding-like beta-propeller repeat protein [Candidatus Aegiribacteria sp.]|nr:PQQ-binding-like beta-propeller repeat protein [Candidatus Aegiribacteria sp.]
MTIGMILTAILISTTAVTITEPVDGETYDGDWLPLRAIVENENEVPDSVHYSLNGAAVVLIPRLNTDWYTYMQNDLHHGYSESPAPHNNTVLWTAPITGTEHEFPTPVVVNGLVYYPQDHGGEDLYALDAATGEVEWIFIGTGDTDDAVTVKDGRLYTASDSIWCLDALTGERIWAFGDANWTGSTPAVVNGNVFCGRRGVGISIVFCLDAATGAEIWTDTIPGETMSCMTIWNGKVFIPTFDNFSESSLYALDANSGSIIWENTDSYWGYWDSSPVVVDSVIYISGFYNQMLAIDAMTGTTIWEAIYTDKYFTATPAYNDGKLYFADEIHSNYSIDAFTGNTIWEVPGGHHGSSGIADGIVIFGEIDNPDGARVIALDSNTGENIWSYQTGGSNICSSPAITDGIVYIAGMDWNLYAFGVGLKYTYREEYFYAEVGPNELIVTSFDGGTAVAADTINFTVTQTGISLEPSTRLALYASPNPFYSIASISFELSEPGWTSVTVYDLSGRIVRTLENSEHATGQHSIVWDGRKENGELVSAGLYLCRIKSGGISETTGLCLLR